METKKLTNKKDHTRPYHIWQIGRWTNNYFVFVNIFIYFSNCIPFAVPFFTYLPFLEFLVTCLFQPSCYLAPTGPSAILHLKKPTRTLHVFNLQQKAIGKWSIVKIVINWSFSHNLCYNKYDTIPFSSFAFNSLI